MHCGEMEFIQDNNQGRNGGGKIGVVGFGDNIGSAIGGLSSGEGGLSELLCENVEEIDDYGSCSNNGLLGSEPPCLVTMRMGEGINNHGVPPFLIKLYSIVDDKSTSSIISWGSSGTTFIIFNKEQFTTMIMRCYFKTNRFESFLNQLNNYGFKRKTWKHQLEFEHEQFQEGKPHWLKNIKRKKQQPVVINNHENKLKSTFVKVRHEQKQYRNKILHLKYDIEQTLLEVQTITKAMINKLLSTFSKTIGRKRTFLDMDQNINFVDIEKDFHSTSDQCEVSGNGVNYLKTLSDLKEKVITEYGCRIGEGVRRDNNDGFHVPKFLHTLYKMVEKEEINDLISWNYPSGDGFIISDINKFETDVIPKYFKHNNFSSFNSQLNIYGFKKKGWERHEYTNEWFRRGRYDFLANIKKRARNLQLVKSCSKAEVEVFDKRLKTIQNHQANKVIRLSNYEEQIKSSLHELKETIINMTNVVDKTIEERSETIDFEKHVIGNGEEQEPEVYELDMTPRENNNQGVHYYFQESELEELGIDPEEAKKFMMEWKACVLKDTSCS